MITTETDLHMNFYNDRKRYYKGYRVGNQRTIGQNHDQQKNTLTKEML
jgi:hypothetical protein